MVAIGYPQVAAGKAQHRVVRHVRLRIGRHQHAHARHQQEGAKQVQHPAELAYHPCAGHDHHGTHDDRAQHAINQHAALVLDRHLEGAEDQQEDEHVIDRQRFLDQVAGEKFQRLLIGDLGAGRAVQIPPQAAVEQQGQADPHQRPRRRFLDADLVRLVAAEDEQVQRQHHQNKGDEAGPHGCRCNTLQAVHRWPPQLSVSILMPMALSLHELSSHHSLNINIEQIEYN